MNYNVGDIIFQVISLCLLLAIIYIIYQFIKIVMDRKKSKQTQNNHIEEKLDKVIDLLENKGPSEK